MDSIRSRLLQHSPDLRILSAILRTPKKNYRNLRLRTSIPASQRALSTSPFSSHSNNAASQSSKPSSVSESEVSHFSNLAGSWWDPHGPSRLLHLMNPLRHDFIQSCLREGESRPSLTTGHSPPTSQKSYTYLDVGCGGGIFASSAARLPQTSAVTGIDPTSSVIEVAISHQRRDPALRPPKLRYLACSIEELSSVVDEPPIPPTYDIVTLFEVLEHTTHPSPFLRSCVKHLRPGGWLFGSTISRSPLSFVTTKLIAEAPLVGVVPRGTHDWNQYINLEELREWFAEEHRDEDAEEMTWGPLKTQGVIYLPALGWRVMSGSERFGNYFFGVQRLS